MRGRASACPWRYRAVLTYCAPAIMASTTEVAGTPIGLCRSFRIIRTAVFVALLLRTAIKYTFQQKKIKSPPRGSLWQLIFVIVGSLIMLAFFPIRMYRRVDSDFFLFSNGAVRGVRMVMSFMKQYLKCMILSEQYTKQSHYDVLMFWLAFLLSALH